MSWSSVRRIGPVAVWASLLAGFLAGDQVSADEPGKARPAADVQKLLDDLVPKLRKEKKLVGLAAMILVDGKQVAAGVDGERINGSGVPLEIGDRWHLGSITKSLTATVAARMVERKEIEWTTTIGDCFGTSVEMHDDWRSVTLEHLLTHTSGALPNFSLAVRLKRPAAGKQRMLARKAAIAGVLKRKPKSEPGESFVYSNVGYTIAGTMLEHTSNEPWEALIRKEIFGPLSLREAGFGPPKDGEQAQSQPHGHRVLGTFKQVVDQEADNTPIMGPAGTIHMSLAELCRYGQEHMDGESGKGKLLAAATYRRLHTPKLQNYAFGWVAPKKNRWVDERIVWHNGSNTMWYALVVQLPERNAIVAVTSNDGDVKGAESAAFEILRQFGK